MASYRIEVTKGARLQIQTISSWWRENRPKNPSLFRDELIFAKAQLMRLPSSGSIYQPKEHPSVRRLLLSGTQHHLYYVVDEGSRVVTLLAVWHTARGGRPPI